MFTQVHYIRANLPHTFSRASERASDRGRTGSKTKFIPMFVKPGFAFLWTFYCHLSFPFWGRPRLDDRPPLCPNGVRLSWGRQRLLRARIDSKHSAPSFFLRNWQNKVCARGGREDCNPVPWRLGLALRPRRRNPFLSSSSFFPSFLPNKGQKTNDTRNSALYSPRARLGRN